MIGTKVSLYFWQGACPELRPMLFILRLETACRRKIQYAHINIAEGQTTCNAAHESELLVTEDPEAQLTVIYTPFMGFASIFHPNAKDPERHLQGTISYPGAITSGTTCSSDAVLREPLQ